MRHRFLMCGAFVVAAACSGSDGTADSAAAATAATQQATPQPIQLTDVAGVWTVRGMPMDRDTVIVTYELTATADTTGWTITFPGRPPVPVRVVSVAGDSVTTSAGPYESVLRPGVQVTTVGAFRLRDGRLVGNTVARYSGRTADSVITVRSEGERKP
jgi:hypothetical protein